MWKVQSAFWLKDREEKRSGDKGGGNWREQFRTELWGREAEERFGERLWVDCQESDGDNGCSHRESHNFRGKKKPLKIFSSSKRCWAYCVCRDAGVNIHGWFTEAVSFFLSKLCLRWWMWLLKLSFNNMHFKLWKRKISLVRLWRWPESLAQSRRPLCKSNDLFGDVAMAIQKTPSCSLWEWLCEAVSSSVTMRTAA